MTNNKDEKGWREEFDNMFQFAVKYKDNRIEIVDFDYHKSEIEELKSFISKVEQDTYKRARQEILDYIKDKKSTGHEAHTIIQSIEADLSFGHLIKE